MRTELNFIVNLILVFFWWQANLNSNAKDLNFQKYKLYGKPRYKRSPESESDVNDNNVDNIEHKYVDNRQKTQIENTQTPNHSMINDNETINDFYFDEEMLEQWIGNWGSQCSNINEQHRKHCNSDIANKNGDNIEDERQWQQSSDLEEGIFSKLQPIENFDEIRTPIDLMNCNSEPIGKCFRSEVPNDKCTDEWQCQFYNKNITIFSVVNVYFPIIC